MLGGIKHNIIANFAGRGYLAVLSLIGVPFYLKILGSEAYGLIGFYTSLQAMLSLLDLGIGGTLSRELAKVATEETDITSHDTVFTFEVVYWLVGIIAGILLIFSSSFLVHSWLRPEQISPEVLQNNLIYMIIAIIIQWPCSLYSSGLIGLQKQVALNVVNIITTSVRIIGSILVINFYSPTIEAFFGWQIFSALLQTFCLRMTLWTGLRKQRAVMVKGRFKKVVIESNWRFAIKLCSASVMGVLLGQIDKFVLSTALPLKEFGYYMLANTVAQSINLFAAPISDALFPKYVEAITDKGKNTIGPIFINGVQFICTVVIPIAAVLFIFSNDILNLWLHDQVIVNSINTITRILTLAVIFNCINNTLDILQVAYGVVNVALYKSLVVLVVAGPLIWFLSSHYGALGASLAWLMIYFCTNLIMPNFVFNKMVVGHKLNWYRSWIKIMIISVGVVYIFSLLKFFEMNKLLSVIYFGMAWFFAFGASVMSVSSLRQSALNFLQRQRGLA